MLTGVHHVGIAVADLDASIELYRIALGAELVHRARNEKDGIEAVAYGVTDIAQALAHARDAGLELIDSEPRMGMHGSLIAFVHPKSLGGVLTELVET